MRRTIDETIRKRKIQIAYNEANGITPKTVLKSKEEILEQTSVADSSNKLLELNEIEIGIPNLAADPILAYMSKDQLAKAIKESKSKMESASKNMDFMEAAKWRDEMFALEKVLADNKN
jgi:excinuclease ABC subunit B